MTAVPRLRVICGFRLVTRDLDRLGRFYEAIGFTVGEAQPIAADEIAVLSLGGSGKRLPLTLGPSAVALDWFKDAGEPYSADATAADMVFQHLALVTSDAAAAWERAHAAGATPISRDGPITLPASSGGVIAAKFRDPDGHPLELLQFPAGSNAAWPGSGMLGIDHTAISIADIDASRRFYEEHGLTEGKQTLNRGPTQEALDGLDTPEVDVVPMLPAFDTPHLELLGYRHPRGRLRAPAAVNDVVATRIVWRADRDALVRDPDGHLHQLVST